MNKEYEKIYKILNEKIDIDISKISEFNFGEFIEKPNQSGCFKINSKWFTYIIDEKNFCTFTGPFEGDAIIYASAKLLNQAKLFKEYKFSHSDLKIYINNNFHSFDEIDSYMNIKGE